MESKTYKSEDDLTLAELLHSPEALQDLLRDELKSMKLSREVRGEIEARLGDAKAGIRALDDLIAFSEQEREEIYQMGYNLYNAGIYNRAIGVFLLLVTLDERESRYSFGLAASHHAAGKYPEAVCFYLRADALDNHSSPLYLYHAADCLVNMNQLLMAREFYQKAALRCANTPDQQAIKRQCLLLASNLTRRIDLNRASAVKGG